MEAKKEKQKRQVRRSILGKIPGAYLLTNADTGRVTGHGRSFKLLSDKKAIGDHADGFLSKENHSLYEWFKKAYGDE